MRASDAWSSLWKTDGPGVLGVSGALHGRPWKRIGLETGLEVWGGEAGGFRRFEFGYSLINLLVYFTPESKYQLYATAGYSLHITSFDQGPDGALPQELRKAFVYMGGVFGGGIEARVKKSLALRFEIRGFLRGRLDSAKEEDKALLASHPDFDQGTKSVRGVMFAGGLVFF